MPNYRRSREGQAWFFTVVTRDRAPVLVDPKVRTVLREALDELRARRPFRIEAWVLLPDHLHCIWRLPDGERDYSMRWGWLKKEVTKRAADGKTIWQPRFWEHQLRDERDFGAHFDYIHYNPVKHGLVACAKSWPWSTFHRFVKRGIYPSDWGCAEIGLPEGVGRE